MRLEKGFLHWKSDILTEFDPYETGLGRFVKLDKAEFIGKDALLRRKAAGPVRRLVTLAIDADHAPAFGGASIRAQGHIVGTVTSGGFGHRTGLNLAYAFLEPGFAAPGTEMTADIIGEPAPARVIEMGPYDPGHARMRG
jgi:dimethylglycine dehydrogenase